LSNTQFVQHRRALFLKWAKRVAVASAALLVVRSPAELMATFAPGFDATGFRCKSLTICQNASACIYYSADMLGSLQSMEDTYTDGAELASAAVKLVLQIGAASQCNNPPVTFTADDLLTLTFDGGKKLAVYLPMFMGTSLTLYIANDGSTFTDAALTTPARLRP
jgi:hypothetical protein